MQFDLSREETNSHLQWHFIMDAFMPVLLDSNILNLGGY